MNPLFPYYGGKARIASRLVDLMPPHKIYVEPFAGSLAVLLAKRPVRHEIANDSDGNVVTFFRMLREQPDDLARVLQFTPYARDEYETARLDVEIDDLERARRFFVRATQGFNAAGTGSAAGWSHSAKRNQDRARTVSCAVDRLTEVANRLRGIAIENRDACAVIEKYDGPDTVIYADPCYLSGTRSSRRDYRHDGSAEADHRRYAKALRSCAGTVFLSGYASPLYDELYADWQRIEIPTIRPTANRDGASASVATEVVWTNAEVTR